MHIPGLFVFQPTEFAKIGLVIFLASYLRDTRQVMVMGARRFLGVTIPPLKHFGPVLVIWGMAMVILVLLHDIGSSLMFYGALLAVLYVATDGSRSCVVGLVAFGSAPGTSARTSRTSTRASRSGCTRSTPTVQRQDAAGSYQLANALFAQAAGGLFGQGFGQATLTDPGHAATYLLPAPEHRHDLRGHHRRARAVRRLRRAAHLPAVRRARVQDGDARARLVLEAAGGRASARSSRCRCS